MTVLPAADIELEIGDLAPDAARALLALRAEQMRGAPVAVADTGLSALVWTLGGEAFALPLADVATVLPAGRATPVPGAHPALAGVAVRRGRLLNIVDPGAALGVATGTGEHWLVLRGPAPRLALRVDRVETVAALADVPATDGLTAQATLPDGRRVSLVDRDRLIEALGLAQAKAGE